MIFLYSAIGFGQIHLTRRGNPDHLQEILVKELNNKACEKIYVDGFGNRLLWPKLKELIPDFDPKEYKKFKLSKKHIICIPPSLEKNIALGDSGGPLLLQVSLCELR